MEYWLIITGPKEEPGINGGLLKRDMDLETGSPSGFVCTVDVPSIDEYSETVKKSGGMIVMPKMEITGMGWLVYCKDTEGNIFGMMESTMPPM